jgi:hypothetical protein
MRTVGVKAIVNDEDWQESFRLAGKPIDPRTRQVVQYVYPITEVLRVVCAVNGDSDGDEWVGVFLMRDGGFLIVRGGCYQGWDRNGSASAERCSNQAEAIACLTDGERERLGVTT